jgi:hypothetical protein
MSKSSHEETEVRMKVVYRSVGISDLYTGEPVFVTIAASEKDMSVRFDIATRKGASVAQLVMLPGEFLAWADRMRHAAKWTMGAAEAEEGADAAMAEMERKKSLSSLGIGHRWLASAGALFLLPYRQRVLPYLPVACELYL